MTTLGTMQQGVKLGLALSLLGLVQYPVSCITGDSENDAVNVADCFKNNLSGKGGCTELNERGECD